RRGGGPVSAPPITEKVRPSAWWIVVGVVAFVVGVAGCSSLVGVGVYRAFDVETLFAREGTIQLSAGDYTVYLSDESATVTITAPDGSDADLRPYDGNQSVTKDGTDYHAAYTFTAEVDGRYTVVRDGAGRVAIGKGFNEQAGLFAGGAAI